MDDDDDFLYGGSAEPTPKPTSVPQPVSYQNIPSPNGVVSHLENEAEKTSQAPDEQNDKQEDDEEQVDLGEEEEQEQEQEEEEEDEDDIEFIMEPAARSIDFRQQPGRPPMVNRVASSSAPSQPKAPQPLLTTEYTPIQRGAPPGSQPPQTPTHPSSSANPPQTSPTPSQQQQQQPRTESAAPPDDSVDTNSFPPVTAPPSHPKIDPTVVGVFDGNSILEVDLNAMADKPWRRPGSDISDWFNYGFDEISWEAYCYRRRDMGELANVMKTNVINFSGMPEDQLTNLPPEARQMVMTGTMAMMNGATPNPAMMGPGMMMDMGMGMGGMMDMGMGMGGMMSMADGGQGQQSGVVGGNGTPEPNGMMQDGFNPGQQGMMNMGMGGDYGMQDQNQMAQMAQNQMAQNQMAQNQMAQNQMAQNQMAQSQPPMYPAAMEIPVSVTPTPSAPAAAPIPVASGNNGRGTPVATFPRGRPIAPRGRGFAGRGRGRGGYDAPPVPIRPASPLPPGVPTGPRNQNKYKDRDGNAPAVDGLDYGGGGAKDIGRRTPSGEPEERASSRKRRSSPSLDDSRSSKRR